jgi:uncharacterized protein (DUF1697 family)
MVYAVRMTSSATTYVALLRGINVGGNKKVPMADLKKILELMGYKNVKTLLASGNVLFDALKTDLISLTKKIAAKLETSFGFTIPVLMRTKEEIQKLVKSDPFKGIKVTPDIRLYVTFLSEKPKSALKIPFKSADGDFVILRVTDDAVISVLDLSKGMGTIDSMAIIEKEFGKNVTTRNWNTVLKLIAGQ